MNSTAHINDSEKKKQDEKSIELIRCFLFEMAGEVGVEPTPTVLETGILPLYYSPVC